MKRETFIYIIVVFGISLGVFFLLHLGNQMTPSVAAGQFAIGQVAASPSVPSSMAGELRQHASDPLARLFLQLLVILAASWLVGRLFLKLGQPAVVGEMMAGILLGPSLFGFLAPDTFHYVFAPESLGPLKLFSQIGVCLFMFVVGMELNLEHVRRKAHTAVVVSHASIVIPFFLGVLLALGIYRDFAQPGASFMAFALFLGISMSITAFPVLARILRERGMTTSVLGVTVTTCAAVDDVTAWSILAFVVAIVRSASLASAAISLVLVLVFVSFMFRVVKPLLPSWLGRETLEAPEPDKGVLVLVIGIVLASAFTTEMIGVHALFGSFLAGTIMPAAADFRHRLAVRVETLSSILLLPLFFAFTGLRTQLGLLHGSSGWLLTLGVIALATLGKLGGSTITARFTGVPWNEALQLGALMNTRGLMELIALNIGLDLGILSPRIFASLVIMALATTAMTGPLLTFLQKRQTASEEHPLPAAA